MAKRIAKQGEEVISSNPEAAFTFASVAVALWDWGTLANYFTRIFTNSVLFWAPTTPNGLADNPIKNTTQPWGKNMSKT
jgi:hypothetical protein